MQSLVKYTLYLFLIITALTAVITLAGIVYVWFFSEKTELPHLELLYRLSDCRSDCGNLNVSEKGFEIPT